MEIDKYSTSDFHLAAALTTLGFNLMSVDRTNPKRSIFIFENKPELQHSVSEYYQGKLKLDPRVVLFQAKLVKDRLYSG